MSTAQRKTLVSNLLWPISLVAIMWAVKLAEAAFQVNLAHWGLYPRTWSGIPGILTTPFLHGDFFHLINNTLPFVITGFAMLSGYPKVAKKAFLWIFFLTGFWVWVAARPSFHIGASGLVYGMISFLLFMGIFRREKRSIALALMVTFLYGSFVWGIFPIDPKISWESHALGAIAGIFAAILYWKVDLEKPTIEDPPEEEVKHIPYWKYEVEGKMKEEYKNPPPPEKEGSRPLRIHYIFKPKPNKEEDRKIKE